MSFFKGKYVSLRAPEPEDLEYLYNWENDTGIWQISNTITPFSRYTLKKYIETSHLNIYENQQLRLMIDLIEEKKTIGTIDLFDFDPYNMRAGVGILLGDEKSRGKGNADDALKVLIQYSFDVLLLHQLYSNVSAGNEKSIKLFENNGFVMVGEKKDWLRTQTGWKNEYLLQLLNHNAHSH